MKNVGNICLPAIAIALLLAPSASAQSNTQKSTTTTTASSASSATGKSTGHETVEYKDPEDMTTRYRPGNNKTTAAPPNAPGSATPAATPATGKPAAGAANAAKQSGIPACDGASKDAAKCSVAPSAPSGTGKSNGAGSQTATSRVHKVEAITVKQ